VRAAVSLFCPRAVVRCAALSPVKCELVGFSSKFDDGSCVTVALPLELQRCVARTARAMADAGLADAIARLANGIDNIGKTLEKQTKVLDGIKRTMDSDEELELDIEDEAQQQLLSDLLLSRASSRDMSEEDRRAKHEIAQKPCSGLLRLTDPDLLKLREIFDVFDSDKSGALAQREALRLLLALKCLATHEDRVKAIHAMDEDESGTIEFDEMVTYFDQAAYAHPVFYTTLLRCMKQVKMGFAGTTWRKSANIHWLTNNGIMVLTVLAMLQALIYFKFVLVPLVMGYFITFLLGPIQDCLTQRPYFYAGRVCCDDPCIRPALNQAGWDEEDPETGKKKPKYKTIQQKYEELPGMEEGQWDGIKRMPRWTREPRCCYAIAPKGFRKERYPLRNSCWGFFTLGKIPESLTVLGTLAVAVIVITSMSVVVAQEVSHIAGNKEFMGKLSQFQKDFDKYLKTELEIKLDELQTSNTSTIKDFTADEIATLLSPFMGVINDTVITLLLALYMLLTRQVQSKEEEEFKDLHDMTVWEKIVQKVRTYVVLKTAISALTGALVGLTLSLCGVQLAVMFGMMTFVLNFIPNVGSMLAMFLPLPLIILDDELTFTMSVMAFSIPALIQTYIGNFLEPQVFGKSLNVTALAVLFALVLWGSVWGIPGAILSVPLLAATKVLLEEADYPMAKMALGLIRESSSVDDLVDAKLKLQEQAGAALKNLNPLRSDEDGDQAKKRVEKVNMGFQMHNPMSEEAEESEDDEVGAADEDKEPANLLKSE